MLIVSGERREEEAEGVAFSNTSDLEEKKKCRWQTRTARLIFLTKVLNVITRRNAKLIIRVLADPWSARNWHERYFFFAVVID